MFLAIYKPVFYLLVERSDMQVLIKLAAVTDLGVGFRLSYCQNSEVSHNIIIHNIIMTEYIVLDTRTYYFKPALDETRFAVYLIYEKNKVQFGK